MVLGLLTFAIDAKDDAGDRLGYTVTLLLADVATLQLVAEKMPKIAYWTVLDYYMYQCFIYLVALSTWCALAGRIETIDYEDDDMAFWVFVALFFLSNLFFLVLIIVKFQLFFIIIDRIKNNFSLNI